jgi:hypothetical protein
MQAIFRATHGINTTGLPPCPPGEPAVLGRWLHAGLSLMPACLCARLVASGGATICSRAGAGGARCFGGLFRRPGIGLCAVSAAHTTCSAAKGPPAPPAAIYARIGEGM